MMTESISIAKKAVNRSDYGTFVLPDGMVGRFAVVKLWPDIKAAEDENIARLKRTATALGLKCIEITPEGEIIGSGGLFVSQNNCDFVIHLHFETPKIYDVFSFVALWNPVKFYHDWGYERFSNHLLTHDDFLSCRSTWTDDHVRRLISNDKTHLEPKFTLFHSLSEPIHPPAAKKFRLFYAGINWERLGKGRSRHQELLDLLDKTESLRIYGPKIFQGVEVWKGYKSYQKEIPFDGVSMVNQIAKCGASLVLSSEAHKQSELMSNRLFESVAAGALVICDENPFAKRHFGDSLLYIDTSDSIDNQYEKIVEYLEWANKNPDDANVLATRAQDIFLQKFALDKSIVSIYHGLAARKTELAKQILPSRHPGPVVRVFCLVSQFNRAQVVAQVDALSRQTYKRFKLTFVIEAAAMEEWGKEVDTICRESGLSSDYLAAAFCKHDAQGGKTFFPIGQVLIACLESIKDEDYCLFLAPNELMLSNHLEILVGSAIRNPRRPIYATACLLQHTANGKRYHDYYKEIIFDAWVDNKPNGFGRYLIDKRQLRGDIYCALSYLDKLCMAVFFGKEEQITVESPATLTIKIQDIFPPGPFDHTHELSICADYSPWLIKKMATDEKFVPTEHIDINNLSPTTLTLENMSNENRAKLFGSLLQSVLPNFITKPLFWFYDKFSAKKE